MRAAFQQPARQRGGIRPPTEQRDRKHGMCSASQPPAHNVAARCQPQHFATAGSLLRQRHESATDSRQRLQITRSPAPLQQWCEAPKPGAVGRAQSYDAVVVDVQAQGA